MACRRCGSWGELPIREGRASADGKTSPTDDPRWHSPPESSINDKRMNPFGTGCSGGFSCRCHRLSSRLPLGKGDGADQ